MPASAAQRIDELDAVHSGTFVFHPALPISKKSTFGDRLWDWTDELKPRLKLSPKGKLRFDWGAITLISQVREVKTVQLSGKQLFIPQLPEKMIEDLKRAFFIISSFPSLIQGRGRRARKAISIVLAIRLCTNFLSHLYSQCLVLDNLSRIDKLSDITVDDIRRALKSFPYRHERLKTVLAWLTTESVQRNLKYGRLQWTLLDLKTIRFSRRRAEEHIKTLPDPLFALLSNKSSALVTEFHALLGHTTRSSQRQSISPARAHWTRFREMLDSYIGRRHLRRVKGSQSISNHTTVFIRQFGIEPRDIFEFLYEVQNAAFNLILLYTGMRYSEAGSLQVGCVVKRGNTVLLKSSLIKGQPSNLPIDCDEWVAIDAVEDAVHALEEIAKCTFNEYLFSNFDTVLQGQDSRPLSDGGLRNRLIKFLRKIDRDGKWTEWQITTHQYRHGLINQLAKAEVGIPYITRQLKHCHTLLSERSYKINQTSTIYGMQKEILVGSATGQRAVRDANIAMAVDLYGEGRRFAGGGAEAHIKRTEAFFRGVGLEGKHRKEYIERLGSAGISAIRTGVGWCVRNHVDPQKLKEAPPPCIGDLQCNPHTCVHSVVPEGRKAEVIARYRYAARQLASPDQRYLHAHWKAEMAAYAVMLEQLGIEPKSVLGAGINPRVIADVLAADRTDNTPHTVTATKIVDKQLQ